MAEHNCERLPSGMHMAICSIAVVASSSIEVVFIMQSKEAQGALVAQDQARACATNHTCAEHRPFLPFFR